MTMKSECEQICNNAKGACSLISPRRTKQFAGSDCFASAHVMSTIIATE